MRAFSERHQLDDEQRQRAQSVLHAAEERAEALWRKVSGELDDLDRLLESARGTEEYRSVHADVAEQRSELFETPLARILEEQLKPDLDRLLTRRQRKPAETQPSE